jgi:hypothetical protein
MDSSHYISRMTASGKPSISKPTTRNWWLVTRKTFPLNKDFVIIFPEGMVGKRVRLKVEVME